MKKEKLTPIHGGWGKWSSFGECSRPCGGGVRYATRECNNPLPANGGYYCVGKRYKYKSCNYHLCKGLKKSFRTSQCEAFNGKNLGIPGVPSSVKWVPKSSGVKKNDLCKLLCEIKGYGLFYDLASKVIDGTKCKRGSNDVCVNGRCMVGVSQFNNLMLPHIPRAAIKAFYKPSLKTSIETYAGDYGYMLYLYIIYQFDLKMYFNL